MIKSSFACCSSDVSTKEDLMRKKVIKHFKCLTQLTPQDQLTPSLLILYVLFLALNLSSILYPSPNLSGNIAEE